MGLIRPFLIIPLVFISACMAIDTSCTYTIDDRTLLCQNYINLNGLSFNVTGPIKNLILKPLEERANSFTEELVIFFDKIKLFYDDDFNVRLENFVDFEIGFNPFVLTNKQGNELVIDRSVLEFKSSGMGVNCASYVSSTQQKMFSKFKLIKFDINMIYREGQCPIIFGDSNLNRLTIMGIDYIENPFSFARFIGSSGIYRSTVNQVEILEAELNTLGPSILNPDVFRQVREIYFESVYPSNGLKEIDKDTFSVFRELQRLELSLNNFGKFFRSSNGQWQSGLNAGRISDFVVYLIDQDREYEFPDEDFCAFSQFPTTTVEIVVESRENLACSCTLAYLIQKSSTQTESTRACFENGPTVWEEIKRNCTFGSRVQECARSRTTTLATTTSTRTTTKLVEKKTKDDTTTIVFAVVAGLVLLILLALVAMYFRRKRIKQAKKQTKKSDEEYINIIKVN